MDTEDGMSVSMSSLLIKRPQDTAGSGEVVAKVWSPKVTACLSRTKSQSLSSPLTKTCILNVYPSVGQLECVLFAANCC